MIFSHSMIETYDNCPMKFKMKYIDRIKIREQTIEQVTGSLVHETLENLHSLKDKGKTPEIGDLNEFFKNRWNEIFSNNFVKIVRGTESEFRLKGISCIENYYWQHYPFNKDKTLFLEHKISFKIDDFQFRGIIDRVATRENSSGKELLIHDYKTSNSLTRENLIHEKQLGLYSIPLANQYPNHTLFKVHHILPKSESILTKITSSHLNDTKKYMLKKALEISQADYFPPNVSPLCNWCEFRRICPAWV